MRHTLNPFLFQRAERETVKALRFLIFKIILSLFNLPKKMGVILSALSIELSGGMVYN